MRIWKSKNTGETIGEDGKQSVEAKQLCRFRLTGLYVMRYRIVAMTPGRYSQMPNEMIQTKKTFAHL
ncbi:MAG TPA: hypothetical protein VN019_07850 [Oxalicibacterium sp.]|nr:hypothetical protein [Oxalicibacterium sp.]